MENFSSTIENLDDKVLKIYYKLLKIASKRAQLIQNYGLDTKYAYHVVRLLNEAEQILVEGDLDLERNREQLKSIRRGEWTMEDIENYFNQKERELENIYSRSSLRYSPDEAKIKQLLLNCLEMHFGSLDKCVVKQGEVETLVFEIQNVIDRYRVIR
jgi:hypothetical protein